MPYLYVLNGRQRHKVFVVGEKPGGETIGQRDDADIVLKDPWISWTHAKVARDGARLAIEDLGSTNGTYVNCDKVGRQPLVEDDVVFLGRTHLLFVQSSRVPSAPPPAKPPREGTARFVVPGVRQEIPGLDVSQDSALLSASRESDAERVVGEETRTDKFRGPFADVGRIAELDLTDDDDILLPPTAELSYLDREGGDDLGRSDDPGQSDDHFEIDVAELGLGPPSRSSDGADELGEVLRVHSLEAGADSDPIGLRDVEIARLRAALAARDAEVLRLRGELTKLKEQYLDL